MFTKVPRKWWGSIITTGILALLLWSVNATLAQGPVNSQISYQGYLEESDTAVTGSRNMIFRLYSNDTCTTQVGSNITKNGVSVNDGFFSVELDVTHAHFNGQALWLEVEVASNKLGCQKMLPTPYALSLRPGATINNSSSGNNLILNQNSTGAALRVDSDSQGIYATTENDYAVYGYDGGSTQGQGYGGYFFSQSGIGLYGESTANESSQNPYAIGIYGKSANGVAGYFETNSIKSSIAGVRSESSTGYAVQGVSDTGMGLYGYSNDNYAVYGYDGGSTQGKGYGGYFKSTNGIGLYGESTANESGPNPNAIGIYGKSANGVAGYFETSSIKSSIAGVRSESSTGYAVQGVSNTGMGVYGYSDDNYAVYGYDGGSTQAKGYGGYFKSTNGIGLYGESTAAVSAQNPYAAGIYGRSTNGVAGYFQSSSGTSLYANKISNTGPIIEAYNGTDREFYVDSSGNTYTDSSFIGGGADFAEMLPAHTGLEPGDVLAIGLDGQLTRTTEAYQTTVMGVYSTQPAFLGGAGMDADLSGKIPMAVVGIVPVKASAENGDISPGDLLTTASIPGHAMRCQGVELCFGRTIGKALEGLEENTGTIQVLVILQ